MVRANTIEMQGKPGLTGDVGGMYLKITVLDVTNLKRVYPLPDRLTLLLLVLGYGDQSIHLGVMSRLFLGVWRQDHVRFL